MSSGSIVQASADLVAADPDDPLLRGAYYTPVGGLWIDPNVAPVATCPGVVNAPNMASPGVIVVVPSC